MVKRIGLWMVMVVLVIGSTYSAASGKIGVGLGAHYNVTLKDIDISSFDNSNLSYVASVRGKALWFILDGSIDYCPNPGVDISLTLSPRISFLVDVPGSGIYGGVGVQKTYIGWILVPSEWSNLTYILQAGWEMRLGPLSLSLDAQYESPIFSLQDIDVSYITFGARIFFSL